LHGGDLNLVCQICSEHSMGSFQDKSAEPNLGGCCWVDVKPIIGFYDQSQTAQTIGIPASIECC